MLRRVVAIVVVVACAAGVVAYQVTRPAKAPADPRVFVPSPRFFLDFSPELPHVDRRRLLSEHGAVLRRARDERRRLESLPAMVDLVTALSPHFMRPYRFGAFALVDAGRPDLSVEAAASAAFRANPTEWGFPCLPGLLRLSVWLRQQEAERPGGRPLVREGGRHPGEPRLPLSPCGDADRQGRGRGEGGRHVGSGVCGRRQVLAAEGRRRAERILPKDKQARMKAVAPLYRTMPKAEFEALIAELFKGYE